MGWPKDLRSIECKGFQYPALVPMVRAIQEEKVVWGETTVFLHSGSGYFTWLECKWKIIEIRDMVTSIELLEGWIDNEDLTAAVLRG